KGEFVILKRARNRWISAEPLVARRAQMCVPGVEVAAVHVAEGAVGGAREHERVVLAGVAIDDLLRDDRAPAVTEQGERQSGILRPDDVGQLANGFDRSAHPARSEPAELGVVAAPLAEAGLTVAVVVVGVDGETGCDELLCQFLVSQGVVAEPMSDLHDALRLACFPLIEVHLHTARVDEGAVLTCRRELDHDVSLLSLPKVLIAQCTATRGVKSGATPTR